jgi:hypothetical protein
MHLTPTRIRPSRFAWLSLLVRIVSIVFSVASSSMNLMALFCMFTLSTSIERRRWIAATEAKVFDVSMKIQRPADLRSR